MSWLNDEILDEANAVIARDPELPAVVDGYGYQVAGKLLDQRAADSMAGSQYWERLKREFCTMVCDDQAERYADTRRKARDAKKAGSVLLLPILCAALAKSINLEVAIVTPFAALLLTAFFEAGIESWCSQCQESAQELDASNSGASSADSDE